MERRLYRSRSDRMISGVCGGLAEYLSLDPTLVRVGVVLLAIVTQGGVLIAYLVMSIVVPEEPLEGSATAQASSPAVPNDQGGTAMNESDNQAPGMSAPESSGFEEPSSTTYEPQVPPAAQWTSTPAPAPVERHHRRSGVGFGLVLVLIGVLLLVNQFVPGIDIWRFWPLLIVAAGLSAVIKGVRR